MCSGGMQPITLDVHLGPEIQNLALKFIKYKNLQKVLDFYHVSLLIFKMETIMDPVQRATVVLN